MTPDAINNEVRLPLIQMGSINVVACILIAIIGGLISQQRGSLMTDGVWSLAATIPGVLIPMGILLVMPPKEAHAWSVPVLAGTMIRALTVLTIGMAIYMIFGPAKVVFFLTMLVALMITLIIDVTFVLSLIQKHSTGMKLVGESEGNS
jgi:hypothetical protein